MKTAWIYVVADFSAAVVASGLFALYSGLHEEEKNEAKDEKKPLL
jgi:hypothetical protein